MKNEVVNCKEEILNNLFVKCSCGNDVIEFQHIKDSKDEQVCKIKYYGFINNSNDEYATSYGTEFTMSVENMVRFCHSVYQNLYLFFEEDENTDSIKTLEFNDEYEGSDNIIRVYYCDKDSYMFIQCYYKDDGKKIDMWEIGILGGDNIVEFIVTLLKFAEDISESKQNVLLEN